MLMRRGLQSLVQMIRILHFKNRVYCETLLLNEKQAGRKPQEPGGAPKPCYAFLQDCTLRYA